MPFKILSNTNPTYPKIYLVRISTSIRMFSVTHDVEHTVECISHLFINLFAPQYVEMA